MKKSIQLYEMIFFSFQILHRVFVEGQILDTRGLVANDVHDLHNPGKVLFRGIHMS